MDTNRAEQRKYLYNEIVRKIEDMIDAGELKVGDRLPSERNLAQTFRVSRICIRQAIQALSEKSILESRRGDGTYVCAPDRSLLVSSLASAIQAEKDVLKDIIEFRLLMEPQIASLAAKNITREELNRLKVIVCDQERKNLAGQEDSELDSAFHLQLAQACKNRVVHQVFSTTNDILNESRSEFLQSHARRRISIIGHLKIIDALEAGDSQLAFDAMKEHLLEVERTIFGSTQVDGELRL